MNQDSWKTMWNDLFSREGYAYGTEPNDFVEQNLKHPDAGRILFAAEGEGRNAVYAASLGYNVSAFDISEPGRQKALTLAKRHNVTIDYRVGNLPDLSFEPESFDAIALIYAHFPQTVRMDYFRQLHALLKPGGRILFEGFGDKHLAYRETNPQVGGPGIQELLFTQKEVETGFPSVEFELMKAGELLLDEGRHQGTGWVLRAIGQKV